MPFLDHDDIITPDALYEMALAAKCAKKTGKEANMFYSDEDKVNENRTLFSNLISNRILIRIF